jgi:hypothetical protein
LPSLCQDLTAAILYDLPNSRDECSITSLQLVFHETLLSFKLGRIAILICFVIAMWRKASSSQYNTQSISSAHPISRWLVAVMRNMPALMETRRPGTLWRASCTCTLLESVVQDSICLSDLRCRVILPAMLLQVIALANRYCSILCSCQRGSSQFCGSRPGQTILTSRRHLTCSLSGLGLLTSKSTFKESFSSCLQI